MSKLKLGPLIDEKPVRVTVELPASLHRDLIAYGEALSEQTGRPTEPIKLIVPMLSRFISTDRAFLSARRRAGRSET